MSTLIDTPVSAAYSDGVVEVKMGSGETVSFPVADNPRLSVGNAEQLSDIELSPFGLHRPQLDEDLSIRGTLAGDHGQEQECLTLFFLLHRRRVLQRVWIVDDA